MPTITYTLDDGFGTPDAEIDLWWQPVSPHGESGALVVSGPPKTITSKVGTPTTITNIAATQWRITGLGAYLNESVTIDIPEAGGDVTDRIKAAISIPPGTPVSTLVQAAKTATEIALDELDVPSKEVLDATYAPTGWALKQLAANPDQLAVGTITRSASGAATGFSVAWPDGATGTFTGTESTTFPGAIDSYAITHVLSGVTTTYTQPALTRDTSGAVTARPAIVVS
ncbi:hypothetical protein SEA_CLARK_28 [Gordonia phage Clark]|uniref:Minor tail protein n=1 Tax=Gordonia phage Clark TaxID=2588133 RepID=A0A4Y6EIV2_9CAUD|nr:hypothetical protein PP507_gp28 [Gordonia phage Clark]QDF17977.1 hypothetical protein SEA_CLARK_28 [Gordonia phage Clark]